MFATALHGLAYGLNPCQENEKKKKNKTISLWFSIMKTVNVLRTFFPFFLISSNFFSFLAFDLLVYEAAVKLLLCVRYCFRTMNIVHALAPSITLHGWLYLMYYKYIHTFTSNIYGNRNHALIACSPLTHASLLLFFV